MVVEVRPGPNGQSAGTQLTAGSDGRPDLQIQVNRALGNGSVAICDVTQGGVPGIDPPRYDSGDPSISDVLLDLACRFQALSGSDPCTILDISREAKKIHPEAATQYCMLSSGKATFPAGDTLVTARVRDRTGELGPISQIIVRVATQTPTPKP